VVLVPFLTLACCRGSGEAASQAAQAQDSPPRELESTPRLFEFGFSNIQGEDPDAEPPKAAQVYIKVVKYDPDCGKVEWSGFYKVGDTIGVTPDKETGVPKSRHKVRSEKKRGTVPVDCDTGAQIKAIQTNQVVLYEYKECTPTPAGCSGPRVLKDCYKVNRVVYIDEDGVEQVYETLAGMDRKPDRTCTLHGGKVEVRKITEAELKEWRSAEAVHLLKLADYDWGSKNPKTRRGAQENYRKLSKAFSSEAVVVKNLERIKARSEAEIEE